MGMLMGADRLLKFGQCKETAIVPNATFQNCCFGGRWALCKVESTGRLGYLKIFNKCSVSEFLCGMRRARPQQQHFALLCVPAPVVTMLLFITAARAPGRARGGKRR